MEDRDHHSQFYEIHFFPVSRHFQVPYYYNKLSPYIGYIRDKYEDNTICIEFEKLARSWKTERFLSSNKNIPEEILQK